MPVRVPGCSVVTVSFRLRGISLQKQTDSVGCIILLPCNVAELFFPLVIAVHCLLFLIKEWAGLSQMVAPRTH